MKAIVYKKYGKPEVLRVEEVATPTPKDDEVRIQVHAAEATKGDCELRSFHFQVKWFWLPLRLVMGLFTPKRPILGGYFSGDVESVGSKVTAFKPGDRIFGSAQFRMGAYGEYLCLPADYTLVSVPENISHEAAAAVPLGGLNALHFMNKARIRKGDQVLINGAGGSIGSFAVQIAKSMGAEVTAVDMGFKETKLRQIGADYFIDYTREDFTRNGKTYDVIFNMVAQSAYSACIRSLKPNGRYLLGNPRLSDIIRSALTSKFTNKSVIVTLAGEKREELEALKGMIEAGQITPLVDAIYSMDEAAEAHRRVETEQRVGCVVISMRHGTTTSAERA